MRHPNRQYSNDKRLIYVVENVLHLNIKSAFRLYLQALNHVIYFFLVIYSNKVIPIDPKNSGTFNGSVDPSFIWSQPRVVSLQVLQQPVQ